VSSRDFERERELLRAMLGQRFELTVATSSLKLAFDGANHRHRYLWLDPAWVLEDAAGTTELHSRDCPDDGDAFRAWAAGLDPLRTAALSAIRRDGDTTLLVFENGKRLRSLDGATEDDDAWYDDFYWRGSDADEEGTPLRS